MAAKWWPLFLILGVMTLGAGGVAVYMQTRGIRNNNPGNIRKIKGVVWQGQAPESLQTDADFIVFAEPVMGLRALAKTLNTYRTKYNLNTVAGIISRWAPPIENDTVSYIKSVAQRIGVEPNQPLALNDYPALVAAIVKHENGIQPYESKMILDAIKMAGLS